MEKEDDSESEVEMEDEDEDEIPLEMEDIEAISKKARQDEDLNTEHLQVILSNHRSVGRCLTAFGKVFV